MNAIARLGGAVALAAGLLLAAAMVAAIETWAPVGLIAGAP